MDISTDDDLLFDPQLEQTDSINKSAFFTNTLSHYQTISETSKLSKYVLRQESTFKSNSSFTPYEFSTNKNRNTREDLDSLCYLFADTHQAFNMLEEMFNLLDGFVQNCVDRIDVIQGEATAQEIMWIENERNTWRLMYAIYRNRLTNFRTDLSPDIISESKIIENLFQTDSLINEYQLVIDWLEENAAKRMSYPTNYVDKTVAWENTLFHLQNNTQLNGQRPLVDAMDPDAPLRQNKHIDDLDKVDENKLLNEIFTEIRCGRIHKAVQACQLYGQHWRAAVLQGWMLYNDPNFDSTVTEHLSVEGNPNRDIWKLCAWSLTQSESAQLWKAIVAVFCGNLPAIMPACKNWEDVLWAYLKVLVDIRVEQELRNIHTKSYVDLPDEYWNFKLTLDEIFMELASNPDNSIRSEASKPIRLIQKSIILNNISELITILSDLCNKSTSDKHMLRFSAHIVLCIRLIGYNHNENEANSIIRTYIDYLISYNEPQLVAYYTSFLPKAEQISTYSKYLETVEDPDIRIKCLEYAQSCSIDIEQITQLVVKNIREKTEPKSTASELTLEDKQKVSSLDWIIYFPQQRAEALCQVNALIRQFLKYNKLQAARLAFDKIPEDTISMILDQYNVTKESIYNESSTIPLKIQAAIKEYLSYKSYLDAEEGFAEWFHCFHKDKPTKPEHPGDNIQFKEKIAYEHSLSHYEVQLEEWKTSVSHRTSLVQFRLYNVLLFPDGGWLIDKYHEDKSRSDELLHLRHLCIPKIVLLLHNVLSSVEKHDECIKLADVIVSEDHKLYEVYSKQDLSEIFKKICESSVCLLNENKDPWGLPDVHINKYP